MIKKKFVTPIVLIPAFLMTLNSQADQASTGACATATNATELVRCAFEKGFQTRIQKANQAYTDKLIDVARQRINPELTVESVPNDQRGQNTEAILMHTFETGGKRSARINSAKADAELGRSQLLLAQEGAAVNTVTSLYRLRQLDEEISLLSESSETFRGITSRYRKRIRLAPQQEISLSIFELAADDSQIKLNQLKRERDQVAKTLMISLGLQDIKPQLLPPLKVSWPQLTLSEKNEGAAFRIISSAKKRAEAGVDLAKSQSWPNLSVGPKLETISGNTNDTRVGVALALPLPLFNANGAGRTAARSGLERAGLESELASLNLARERERLKGIYNDSAQAFKSEQANQSLSGRHKRLHTVNRDLLDAALIIELHRQVFEYQVSLHAQELAGVEALWSLYALEGHILKNEVK